MIWPRVIFNVLLSFFIESRDSVAESRSRGVYVESQDRLADSVECRAVGNACLSADRHSLQVVKY